MKYVARREDNGELVNVTFDQIMSQQAGFITLEDGTLARCVTVTDEWQRATKHKKVRVEIVSDTLGVTANRVDEYRENAKQFGYKVEFVPEPGCEHFCQAKFPSWHEKDRYMAFRGLCDKNSKTGSGAPLSPLLLERASQRLLDANP